MKNLPLGKCPFCNGNVTIATLFQETTVSLFTAVRPAGFFILSDYVKCENGCDMKRFYIPKSGDELLFKDDALAAYRQEWIKACSALKNPTSCGRCGIKPKWTITSNSACIDCPRCGRGYMCEGKDYRLGELALDWNKDQAGETRAKNIENQLNSY